MWKIKKFVKKGEYIYAIVPGHPDANLHDYVLAHRVIMENHLGRPLLASELVHHVNLDKHDNNIENLEILSSLEHNRLHQKLKFPNGRATIHLTCYNCEKDFIRYANRKFGLTESEHSYCSRECYNEALRKRIYPIFGRRLKRLS